MGIKRLLFFFLMLVFVIAAAVGCEGKAELTALELIPRNANMIAGVQVSKILNDRDLREAYDSAEKEEGQPQTFDEMLDQVVAETGIDPSNIYEATMFANLTSEGVAEYLGIIVEAVFDKNELINTIEDKAEMHFSVSEYKGYTIYLDQDEEFAITFLSNELVLFGTTQAVKDAVDVSKGEKERITGAIIDTYNRYGEVLIKLAMDASSQAKDLIGGEPVPGNMPMTVEALNDVETIGFALDKELKTLTAQIELQFLSEESAEDAGNGLLSTLNFLVAMSPDSQENLPLKSVLDKIEVEIVDSRVIISYTITTSEIQQMVENYQR